MQPTTRVPMTPPRETLRLKGAGLTHVGRVRDRNEDAILTDPGGTLWAVADGMGGHGQGDIASDIVIERLSHLSDDALAPGSVGAALARANGDILARAGAGQAGATVVAAAIRGDVASLVWAGDCRAYLWRDGTLRCLTRDHTLVQDMIERGQLSEADRDTHPERHVVTRAVGAATDLQTETLAVPLMDGDVLMLCSDGLTACVSTDEMAMAFAASRAPEFLSRALMTRALDNGAPDNVSVVVVHAGRA